MGSGEDMFHAMMNRIAAEGVEVKGIQGNWLSWGMSKNYDDYRKFLAEGMPREAAALKVWTGQRAQEYGFSRVESILDAGTDVKVMFRKPQASR
jgi:hypothetical protein